MCNERVAVTQIQKCCTQDGPGLRTTVFLKGCPLHCAWCHNPETQSSDPQLLYTPGLCIGCGACIVSCAHAAHTASGSGCHLWNSQFCIACGECAAACCSGACEMASQHMTVQEIWNVVEQDAAFYGEQGGMTLSGGEPMFHPRFALALLQTAKAAGISTAMETCGFFSGEHLEQLVKTVDLFLWDIKDTDPARHTQYTGADNALILQNLHRADALGAVTRLRCILVAGVNLTQSHLTALAELYRSLQHCQGIDLLPYHAYGSGKALQLGRPDPAHKEWIPTEEAMANAEAFFIKQNIPVTR